MSAEVEVQAFSKEIAIAMATKWMPLEFVGEVV